MGIVSGTIEVEVTDPEAFLADNKAMESVKEGIADVAGVPQEWVSIQGRKMTSRRLHESQRRLAANLELTYTIECPSDSTSSTVAGVESRMKVVSPAEVQRTVQMKMAAKSVSSTFVAKSIGAPATRAAAGDPVQSSKATVS